MNAEALKYNPVTPEIVEELKGIVGERYVVFGEAEKLDPFSHDEVPDRKYAHMPEALVRPRTADQIAAIMKLANRRRIPVTPRGAGSGLSGGAVPLCGGIVLLCDRMNEILEIDRENMMIVVEPGVVTAEINERIAPEGLFYAGYPMSLETCTVGGNVAENAGGGKAVKYGVTGRYVLGLEMVSPTGEIVSLGGKLIKDVTGYSLIPLMVGSEGTLGIFTKITLRLLPLSRANVDLLVLFASADQALAAVPDIMTQSGITPTAIEFMDKTSVQAACEYLNETIPYAQAGAMLIITLDGPDVAQLEQGYEAIGEGCLAAGAVEVYVADNATTSERIWKVRRNIGEAFGLVSPHQANEDLVVPPAAIALLLKGMQKLGKKYGLVIPSYGHAGDGNLHTRIIKPHDWPIEKWNQKLPNVLKELYELTAGLGGRLSGEHGIGHKRKPYMSIFISEPALEMMRAVKLALDPNNILNPGKIFDL
ncbi:MAG: FAD-linked oxidase C-terminal domain-containing protein [Planctomycetota bacterium]|nr:FAD-linked oxidase C-terminal domain-containing protein [Planctomycetota bacterium]